MLDKRLQVNRHYYKVKDSKPIHIKFFGDLHHCNFFQDEKLDTIEKELQQSPTDYVCIVGDLIDSTNYLHTNKEKKEKLIKWLKKIGSQYKVFLTLGNHDFTYYKGQTKIKDIQEDFFEELENVPGIFVSHYDPYYEDTSVIIYQLELEYDYYTGKKHENINVLLDTLEAQKEKMTHLDDKKVKVLMVHSPIFITHPRVLEYIKDFDFIIAGHMHNGLVPPFLTNLIPGNRGLISPYLEPFVNHTRGVETIKLEGKDISMIITGGITKLQNCAPFYLDMLNCFYPMQMDEIIINNGPQLTYKNK